VGKPRLETFGDSGSARTFFEADQPIQDGRDVGISVHESFFGRDGPSGGSGFLGSLLPVRLKGVFKSKILFFTVEVAVEVVLDGGNVDFPGSGNSYAIRAALSSTYAKIGTGPPLVGNGGPLQQVSGSIVLDQLTPAADGVHFRVA